MNLQFDRRRFLLNGIRTGAAFSAFNISSLLVEATPRQKHLEPNSGRVSPANQGVNTKYLRLGLSALARAHHSNTMAGHLGAALIAGFFVAEQHPDLDGEVYRGIERELDRIVDGESVFSPKGKNAISVRELFEPFPSGTDTRVDEGLVDDIAEALKGNLDQTRQSGHNVIFASSAIRALKRHPEYCTPEIVGGIRRLISAFNGKTPGSGYYGKQRGRIDGRKVPLKAEDKFPTHPDLKAMAGSVMDDLILHGAQRRVGYGGLTHVINHAAALVELANYGYKDLANQGLAAHHQHMQLWRSLPDVSGEADQGAPTRADSDPRTKAFWQSGELPTSHAKLTHRIKTLYGFDALSTMVSDERRHEEADQKLRYLM